MATTVRPLLFLPPDCAPAHFLAAWPLSRALVYAPIRPFLTLAFHSRSNYLDSQTLPESSLAPCAFDAGRAFITIRSVNT
jgi:hypothetical protein